MSGEIVQRVEQVVKLLGDRGLTLGLAESCTGGYLSSQLTMMPGVSNIFQGSLVSYANELKTSLLDVPEHAILSQGAVSETVARYMARGARKQLNCDWSLSITGIAGPGGGSPQKPVGTVCFGIAGPGIEKSLKQMISGTERHDIQKGSALFALDLLLNELSE